MYRRGLSGSHVILILPHFQPIRSSDFAALSISQSENVAEAEKCATCFNPVDISGSYLMHPHGVQGFYESNYELSSCSQRNISVVIKVLPRLGKDCLAAGIPVRESSYTSYNSFCFSSNICVRQRDSRGMGGVRLRSE